MDQEPIEYDISWNRKKLRFKWEVIRRHSDFVAFCYKFSEHFDKDGLLDDDLFFDSGLNVKTRQIRSQFGLNLIYHCERDFQKEEIIESLMFPAPFGVKKIYNRLELKDNDNKPNDETIPLLSDPISCGHFIHLQINLSREFAEKAILNELKECIREARWLESIKRRRRAMKTGDSCITEKRLELDPFWNEHQLFLTVDVSGRFPDGKIIDAIKKQINNARERTKIKRTRFDLKIDDFRVYDLKMAGRSSSEIIKDLQLDYLESGIGTLKDHEEEKLRQWRRFVDECEKKGTRKSLCAEMADKKFFPELNENDPQNKLYVRINNKFSRVDSLIRSYNK
jgi:hypothetical protein